MALGNGLANTKSLPLASMVLAFFEKLLVQEKSKVDAVHKLGLLLSMRMRSLPCIGCCCCCC